MTMRIWLPAGVAAAALLGASVTVWAQQRPYGPAMMSQDRGGMGMGMMGGGWGSMPRHHYAMMYGVPEPYTGLHNPLPDDTATISRGAVVYRQNCAMCPGASGAGDGPAGRHLSPPPTDLAWLARMPTAQRGPFMYWSIAAGGSQFGSAMPAFKSTLAKDDIWAVIAYIRAGFPKR